MTLEIIQHYSNYFLLGSGVGFLISPDSDKLIAIIMIIVAIINII